MKYILQFGIILSISFIGELLNMFIPLPIPASIYGMLILFTSLCTGILKLSHVRETGKFLITAMPLMFIAPATGLLQSWNEMQEFIIAIAVTVVFSTVIVIAGAGHMTQLIIKFKGKEKKDEQHS